MGTTNNGMSTDTSLSHPLDRTTAQSILDQVNAAAASSGLDRPTFFAQLAQTNPQLLQQYSAASGSIWARNQPQMSATRNIIGAAALPLAAFALPAEGFGAAASGAGGAASGAGTLASAGGDTAMIGNGVNDTIDSLMAGGMSYSDALSAAEQAASSGAYPAAASSAAKAAASGGGFWNGLTKSFGGGGYGVPLAINTGLDLLGSYLGSNAAKNAAAAQLKYGEEALAFERQRYTDAQGNFAPFIKTGQQANSTLGNYLMPSDPSKAPTAANLAPQFNSGILANAQNNGSNTVTVKAPNGETHAVPGFMLPYYQAKGATVVS